MHDTFLGSCRGGQGHLHGGRIRHRLCPKSHLVGLAQPGRQWWPLGSREGEAAPSASLPPCPSDCSRNNRQARTQHGSPHRPGQLQLGQ
ncbi:Os06g0293583 [Oryza sativa Japonica Group]|uniref:Os06g0293583 protein n=1 Tax=Oryza sativa subsp. japonica TaxID=39947 RepID=A0A0P0WVX2_ORYSJ|nr:hypothetical protein EE612_033468 [Oryza sativa]BAS97320.1 Os06g0293583 [Oryza sativa Japonica Group]